MHPETGYQLRNSEGDYHLLRFRNTLDYSLELIKLREVHSKVYRRMDFSFKRGEKEYTKQVINVTFKYNVKQYNRVNRNVYLKAGHHLHDEKMINCVHVENDELIAIKVGQPVQDPIPNEILGKSFYYEDGIYKARDYIPVLFSSKELRKSIYQSGFLCDGVRYVRYKRSSGSSRVGKCLFINEKLYERMHKWELCGIKAREGDQIDLAALESYIALTLSSIEGVLELNPENILIIKDYNSVFKENVCVTRLEGNKLETSPDIIEIKNNIWDGQSLISPDAMGEYSQYGFVLLRNRFFKSACFSANIQQWFADHNISDISELNGFTMATDIRQIKLITTPSSIKYLKFGTIRKWLKNLDPLFGVVKHDKPTPFFDGRMVQLHYQLLNTLQLTQDEVAELVRPSLEYLHLIDSVPAVLRHHIRFCDQSFDCQPANSKNEIVYKLLGLSEQFTETKMYQEFKADILRSFVRRLRHGHLLVNGNYSTLLGNPIEMLQHAIGQFDGKSQLGQYKICSKRFPHGEELLGSRSPHVTMGNILIVENKHDELIERYINQSNEIVCINSIGENILSRLSGADFDSDAILLTDHPILIKAAKKHYNSFLVSAGNIPDTKRQRTYSSQDQADLDICTSGNRIGEIVNLSQELNTLFWHKVNNGHELWRLMPLYYDIATLDVLSNIEIDKAKVESVIDAVQELKRIREKYHSCDERQRAIKPNFLGHVARCKGYYNSEKKNYLFHDTTMDYLQRCINSRRKRRTGENAYIPLSTLLQPEGFQHNRVKHEQVNQVIDFARYARNKVNAIWKAAEHDLDKQSKYEMISLTQNEVSEYIANIKMSYSTMYWLVRSLESENCKDIRLHLFSLLFSLPNQSFYALIKLSKKELHRIKESPDGDIKIYSYTYELI